MVLDKRKIDFRLEKGNMNKSLEQDFLEVIDQNQYRVQRVCSIYTSDENERKDLVQEVLLNIWKSFPSFKGKSNINSWIYRIVLNVCLHWKYLKGKNKQASIGFFEYEDIYSSPKEEVELIDELRRCIAGLNSANKSIILLFLEELSYKEIGDIIGISENYVAVKIKRIKQQLGICLGIAKK